MNLMTSPDVDRVPLEALAVSDVSGDRDLVKLPSSASPDEISAYILRDGAVIIEDMLSDDDIAAFQTELDPHFEIDPGGSEQARELTEGYILPALTKRVYGIIEKSPTYRKLVLNKTLLAICDRILLPNCYNYQIGTTASLQIGPGEKAQALHRDDLCWPHEHPKPIVQQSFMFALTDFTRENGATCVIPGSHTWNRERLPKPHEAKAAEMRRGSVLAFTGSVLHGAGSNVTEAEHRRGLSLVYILGWLRQEENQYLAVPFEMVKTLDPELQSLLGYDVHEPFLGWVNNLENPKTLLV